MTWLDLCALTLLWTNGGQMADAFDRTTDRYADQQARALWNAACSASQWAHT